MALSLVRYGFRGRGVVDLLVFLPLATPEVVLGAALLALFLTMAVNTGFATIVIAHTMFTISYVVVTVKARLEGMDRHIEEAAMDLGATEWTTFRKITLPMIAPGVAAAALLASAISIDDYVITSFNAGQTQTFPLFIFGATRQGVPPEVNVLATALLVVVLILMALNVMLQRRLAAALAPPRGARRARDGGARPRTWLAGARVSSSTSAASGTATRPAGRRGSRCRRSSGPSGWRRRSARSRAPASCATSSGCRPRAPRGPRSSSSTTPATSSGCSPSRARRPGSTTRRGSGPAAAPPRCSRSAGCSRRSRPWSAARSTTRSCSPGRRGTTPRRRGRWASACSTRPRSRRAGRSSRAAPRGSRSSTGTCTTATAPRRSSATTRPC